MFDYLSNWPVSIPKAAADAAPSPSAPPDAPPGTARELTFAEVRELTRPPSPPSTPASTFAHHNDPDVLALDLSSHIGTLDLTCPDIRALIDSTKGSYQGALLGAALEPKTHVGKHKAKRRKAQPKCKRPEPESLFKLFPSAD